MWMWLDTYLVTPFADSTGKNISNSCAAGTTLPFLLVILAGFFKNLFVGLIYLYSLGRCEILLAKIENWNESMGYLLANK